MGRPHRDHFSITKTFLNTSSINKSKNIFFFLISDQIEDLCATQYCYNSKVKNKYLTLEGWSSGLRL